MKKFSLTKSVNGSFGISNNLTINGDVITSNGSLSNNLNTKSQILSVLPEISTDKIVSSQQDIHTLHSTTVKDVTTNICKNIKIG
jgi:hypothetical protein